jgi:hypothetical protein
MMKMLLTRRPTNPNMYESPAYVLIASLIVAHHQALSPGRKEHRYARLA